MQEEDSKIIFGVTDRDDNSTNRQEFEILRSIANPKALFNSPVAENMLVLVQLDSPAKITDYVRPICINRISEEWKMYENCWIAGWGMTNAYGE